MKPSEFFGKFLSMALWGNLITMFLVVVGLIFGVKYGIELYTHHGEEIVVPNIKHKIFNDAEHILADLDLEIVVADTGYVKTLPADCILDQSIDPEHKVKPGRVIYVTINASSTPTLTLPDIIDNSSMREAIAKLTALGFKVGTPKFIPGEKDWVYGVVVNGKQMFTGSKIPIDATVIILVGNGMRDADDSINYMEPDYPEIEMVEGAEETDEFEEVKPEETQSPADPFTQVEQPTQ